MTDNEKIIVDGFLATTTRDVYDKGEVGRTVCQWCEKEIPIKGFFDTVKDALKAVCKANGLTYQEDWANWFNDFGEEPGRFDTDFTVDAENCEATDGDIEKWKKGEKDLYCLHLNVWLKVTSVPREMTEAELEELAIF